MTDPISICHNPECRVHGRFIRRLQRLQREVARLRAIVNEKEEERHE